MGRGEKDLGRAFENVERGRAELALAANDIACAEVRASRLRF